jgi:PAS domain S-box-containing protein
MPESADVALPPDPAIAAAVAGTGYLREAKAVILGSEETERHFRALLDGLPAAIYTTDAAGRVTYFNQAAVDLAGRRPELGKDEWCVTWRLYQPDGTPLPHDQCPMAVALKENRPVRGVEAILERPDGTRIPFMPYPTPLRDTAGELIGAVNMLIDISERKIAENARAYLAAIVESSDDAIISKDLNGIVASWNRGAELIFGYRADEMIGRPISVLFPPDRLGEEDMILARLRRGERVDHFETVRRRKDGGEIYVSLTISPVRDSTGRIVGVSKIARDITENKRAEAALRALNETLEQRVAERMREVAEANGRLMAEAAERERAEAALVQSQKLEAVGQLASGLAHDFNNLLAVILGNLELLDMRLPDERLRKLVQAAARSAQRGAKLNQQLLAFSRKQHLVPRSIDLNALIVEMAEMLQRTLGGTVKVETVLAPGLWPSLVDTSQLELVLLNLALNARDAMSPGGGSLRIETRNVTSREAGRAADLSPGDYVCVAVSDSGTGMSDAVLARACEPFFTTKGPGKGSGLGLAQVYGFARQSGGGLVIDSALGKGTTVKVYLPRGQALEREATRGATATPQTSDGRTLTILVVDDQSDVREVVAAYLETLGFQVAHAATGRTALGLIGDGSTVDALIIDYAMAEINGIELAQAARAKRPDLPIVMMTGYSDVSGIDAQIPHTELLKKPFRINELASSIERALRNAPGAREGNVVPLRRRAQSRPDRHATRPG